MSVRELLFLNPVFRPGLNLTVRNGTKWADLLPGSDLVLRQTPVEGEQPDVGLVAQVDSLPRSFDGIHQIPLTLFLHQNLSYWAEDSRR